MSVAEKDLGALYESYKPALPPLVKGRPQEEAMTELDHILVQEACVWLDGLVSDPRFPEMVSITPGEVLRIKVKGEEILVGGPKVQLNYETAGAKLEEIRSELHRIGQGSFMQGLNWASLYDKLPPMLREAKLTGLSDFQFSRFVKTVSPALAGTLESHALFQGIENADGRRMAAEALSEELSMLAFDLGFKDNFERGFREMA